MIPLTVETPNGWIRITPYQTPIGMRATVEKFRNGSDTRCFKVETHIDTARMLARKYLKRGAR